MSNETVLWKDARILFNCDDEARISDLVVAEFKVGDKDNWPRELYNYYIKDIGNCNGDWDKWHPIYVILRLWDTHGFSNNESKDKALNQLKKIPEFREAITRYFDGPFAYTSDFEGTYFSGE